jgi:hypothetical protein
MTRKVLGRLTVDADVQKVLSQDDCENSLNSPSIILGHLGEVIPFYIERNVQACSGFEYRRKSG